jgi:selenocysteine-specific elongation factor
MVQEGMLVKVNEDMYFHSLPFTRLKNDYRDFLARNETATPAGFRDLTGLSRKYTIPLMEYFDRTRMTIRVGDHRILRERQSDDAPQ